VLIHDDMQSMTCDVRAEPILAVFAMCVRCFLRLAKCNHNFVRFFTKKCSNFISNLNDDFFEVYYVFVRRKILLNVFFNFLTPLSQMMYFIYFLSLTIVVKN
jgi:hypothetical protein